MGDSRRAVFLLTDCWAVAAGVAAEAAVVAFRSTELGGQKRKTLSRVDRARSVCFRRSLVVTGWGVNIWAFL